jgi:5'-nucleotidase
MREVIMPQRKALSRLIGIIVTIGWLTSLTLGQVRLKILISNDDGVDAPGIEALCNALSAVADVTVAGPSQNRSGVGHGMDFNKPILVRSYEKNGIPWYSVDALPGTCVRLGLRALVREKPDLVVSGINRGENTGTVVYYSGTVACAREAAIQGIPAIAVSLENGPEMDYRAAASFVVELVREVSAKRLLKPGEFLNVNYPAMPKDRIKGILLTRQDLRPELEIYEKRSGPSGQLYYWPFFTESGPGDPKADIWALRNGFISITPMGRDETDERIFPGLKILKKLGPGK